MALLKDNVISLADKSGQFCNREGQGGTQLKVTFSIKTTEI